MLQSTSALLAAVALAVFLVTSVRFVRNAQRVTMRASRTDLVAPLYASLALSLAAIALALPRGESAAVAFVLGSAPLVLSPIMLLIIRMGRLPEGDLRVAVGDCMPHFEALRADGSAFQSGELAGQRVLFKVFRGHWCPFCSAELRQFEAMRPALEARGIRVVALSKDSPSEVRFHAERDHLGLLLLSDPELRVIRTLGLEHHKAFELSGGRFHVFGFPVGKRVSFQSMAIPTTFLIDELGRVRWVDQSSDYQVRADASRVGRALDAAFGPGRLQPDGALPEHPQRPASAELAPCR